MIRFVFLMAVASLAMATLGSLIGIVFGQALIFAIIGAFIPVLWAILLWCFFMTMGMSVQKMFDGPRP